MSIKSLFNLFNLKEKEIRLFEIILQHGPIGATQLAKHLDINRTSVYDLVNHLVKVGMVSETIKNGAKAYFSQPPEKIKLLVEEKEKNILTAKESLDNLQSLYLKNQYFSKPRLQIFEGQEELRQMMKDMLLYDDITVYAYWPIKEIIKILGVDFLTRFHQKRVESNIYLKTIWPAGQIPLFSQYPFLQIGARHKRRVRIAPKGVDFTLGYAIYKNTVRFISSAKENYGFLVESQELAKTMRSQFELIWKVSKPYN